MKITLGSNIPALQAQRQLFGTSSQLSTVFERLSSGQRINRAADDAAGLAIADSLKADTRVFSQGIRNLNDGQSLLNIADSVVNELTGIVTRLKELATSAANGSLSSSQRNALDLEAQELSKEYFRISREAEFNGTKLFDGSLSDGLRLQGGYGVDGGIFSSLGGKLGTGEINAVGTGTLSEASDDILVADYNGDGNLDYMSIGESGVVEIFEGDGAGNFTLASSYDTGLTNIWEGAQGDFNNDGRMDVFIGANGPPSVVLLNNGDGSFTSSSISFDAVDSTFNAAVGDINGDGNLDIVSSTALGNSSRIYLGQGDGSFSDGGTFGSGIFVFEAELADINGDGNLDFISNNSSGSNVTISYGRGDGTFESNFSVSGTGANSILEVADLNQDGIMDLIGLNANTDTVTFRLGLGDGSFGTAQSFTSSEDLTVSEIAVEDVNSDGTMDILVGGSYGITSILRDSEGNFSSEINSTVDAAATDVAFGDFNNDGVLDALGAKSDVSSVFLGRSIEGIGKLLTFSLSTQVDAAHALNAFDHKLNQLSQQRGTIGSFQSRLTSAINTLGSTSENYAMAESRIRDADIAFETSQLIRLQILQNAATAVLGQANLQPALALSLLEG